MKKTLSVLLILLVALTLSACRTQATKDADNLIKNIGTVTLDSDEAISQAEEAVSALTDEEKESLKNASILSAARSSYDTLVQIDDTEKAIAAIGTVTLDSETTIKKARDLYNNCTAEVKDAITNYDILEKAERDFHILKTENLISKIGTVNLSSNEAITAAENEYKNLSADEQNAISNYNTLTAARSEYNELEKKEKNRQAQAALTKLKSDYDKVTGITWYYPSTMPKYIDSRSYVLPYIGKDSSSSWLILRFSYTGNDWVFWKQLTIVVDGQKYYKSFNYFDITHGNDTEVWEYIDTKPSSTDIQMLKEIASSNETIVRFEGDDHYKDLTIKSTDKQAIKDLLNAYELMQ